jgi:hypothetical protein
MATWGDDHSAAGTWGVEVDGVGIDVAVGAEVDERLQRQVGLDEAGIHIPEPSGRGPRQPAKNDRNLNGRDRLDQFLHAGAVVSPEAELAMVGEIEYRPVFYEKGRSPLNAAKLNSLATSMPMRSPLKASLANAFLLIMTPR